MVKKYFDCNMLFDSLHQSEDIHLVKCYLIFNSQSMCVCVCRKYFTNYIYQLIFLQEKYISSSKTQRIISNKIVCRKPSIYNPYKIGTVYQMLINRIFMIAIQETCLFKILCHFSTLLFSTSHYLSFTSISFLNNLL